MNDLNTNKPLASISGWDDEIDCRRSYVKMIK